MPFVPVEGVRYAIHIYIISDSQNAETVVTLEGTGPWAVPEGELSVQGWLDYAGVRPEQVPGDGWRLMTTAEIARYKGDHDA